jgi:chemotaxis protein CheX
MQSAIEVMDPAIPRAFSSGAANYFETATGQSAKIGMPFLLQDRDAVGADYAAIIGIAGKWKGCIAFSAPKDLARAVLNRLGEEDPIEYLCADLIGEIANTIAGNARSQLGAGFLISTPTVARGCGVLRLPADTPCCALPIHWEGERSMLLVAIRPCDPTLEP